MAFVADMGRVKHISFLISLAFLIQCTQSPCLKGSGDIITETRAFNEITLLTVYDNVRVDLHIGNENSIEIKGGENVVPFITTDVSDGVMEIRNENRCNFLREFDNDLRIKITLNKVDAIEYFGSKEFVMNDTLTTNYFRFKTEGGTGDIHLKLKIGGYFEYQAIDCLSDASIEGECNSAGIYQQGSSWLRAGDFNMEHAIVENKSSGDCIIRVDSFLTYSITDIGNIQYYGKPNLTRSTYTGKGRLIPLN